MSETRADSDAVIVCIDKMLESLPSTPSKPSLFRVGDHLRSIKPEAYDPQIIAIGPFHRNKPHLQNMEQHKRRYLRLLLQRRQESSSEIYVTTVRQLEDEARKCYAEDIDLDTDEFVQMLIFDGCFIIEFLRKLQHPQYIDEDDLIFESDHILGWLFNDLLVLENQIPFFIIDRMFNMIKIDDEDNIKSLIQPILLYSFLQLRREGLHEVSDNDPEVPDNAHHLLGIVHHNHGSSIANVVYGYPPNVEYINSAVELEKAGISFQSSEYHNLFHIEFRNKVMKIPQWEISDLTESSFRNLIAYEYYYIGSLKKYVMDYVFFINCLVHSPEDANVLQRSGIIRNLLGTNEMVYRIINQLGKNISISEQFPYSDIFNAVNRECAKIGRTYIEILKREYFNNPWTSISVFAAIMLLGLTFTQTTFAIISYRNDLKKGN